MKYFVFFLLLIISNLSYSDENNQLLLHKEAKKIQTILSFGDKNFDVEVHKLASFIGAYRIIDSNYVLRRHAMEAVDNFNLFSEFTNIISVVGSKTDHL